MRNNAQTERNTQNQENGTYSFGEQSKAANWMLNHPFHIVAGVVLACSVITIPDWTMLMRSLWVDVFLFGVAFLFRLLFRNLCYRVVIDPAAEKITFFRCFNKGIVEAPLRSVEFLFDKHFACLYGGERFTILNEYMHLISEVLPPEAEIKFSDGLYGRFMKKQFERNKRHAQA